MTKENVDLVQAGFEAFARGDIESVLRLCDEDILVTHPFEIPGVAPAMWGHGGVLESIAAWPGQWDDYRLEILKTVDIEEHVVATVHQTGRGKSTGYPSRRRPRWCSRSDRARSRSGAFSCRRTKPSKPWACGSRRCRSRTWELIRRIFDQAPP
jgi:ketosteroid isomerase-like protein